MKTEYMQHLSDFTSGWYGSRKEVDKVTRRPVQETYTRYQEDSAPLRGGKSHTPLRASSTIK